MRYEYYFKRGNEPYKKVSLQELRNELNKVCVKTIYINEWMSAEETDLRKVEGVIRAIKKGTRYNLISDSVSKSISVYAKKVTMKWIQ